MINLVIFRVRQVSLYQDVDLGISIDMEARRMGFLKLHVEGTKALEQLHLRQ